jgi:hypothetical protein
VTEPGSEPVEPSDWSWQDPLAILHSLTAIEGLYRDSLGSPPHPDTADLRQRSQHAVTERMLDQAFTAMQRMIERLTPQTLDALHSACAVVSWWTGAPLPIEAVKRKMLEPPVRGKPAPNGPMRT